MGGCLGFLSGATGRPAETFDSIPRGAAPPSRGEDFESYRAKANKAADNRRNLSAQSQAAWKAGRKSEAHSLSVKSKEQGAKVAEYNALAVKAILDPQNSESTGVCFGVLESPSLSFLAAAFSHHFTLHTDHRPPRAVRPRGRECGERFSEAGPRSRRAFRGQDHNRPRHALCTPYRQSETSGHSPAARVRPFLSTSSRQRGGIFGRGREWWRNPRVKKFAHLV